MRRKRRGRGAALARPGLTPERLRSDLLELTRNLRWSWSAEARFCLAAVAGRLAPAREEEFLRNPFAGVRCLRARDFANLAADPGIYPRVHAGAMAALRRALAPARPPRGLDPRRPVAYFSMEFGLHESLPIYAGGLGILAGDHLKSASDEGVPLVGVGLFYHEGYFRQELDLGGRQRVAYPRAKLEDLPLEAARDRRGRELRVPVELPGRTVLCRVWRVHVGRVDLLLLDTDVRGNRPEDRRINHRLYGGSREDRIRQEVVAGIGGVRALRALGIDPGVWHLNEGHVAFLTLERIRELVTGRNLSFAEAVEVVAADTVFTTHTPVPEGNEAFDLALARKYLFSYASSVEVALEDYLALGLDRGKDGKPFLSMTVLALRLSRFRNGVSKLHGEVSRRMWRHLWPGFRAEDVPIASVTNGVHTRTWVAPVMDLLLSAHLGDDWDRHLDDPAFWRRVVRLPEDTLWDSKQLLKAKLVDFVRSREEARLERLGVSPARREAAVAGLLDPEAFTIGFARRFALYKRSALLFRDLERAKRLFGSRKRPVQIVFAGKPHPEDAAGAAVFERVAATSRMPAFQGRVALLENYDTEVARHLVQGVDVWLNNPRRPLEASGTSGQKVPVNAGLNVSVLDGWWCEGYEPDTGWAIGKPTEYADVDRQDEEDAESLYRVLEREVIPLYYDRDRSGVPVRWLRKVRTSLAKLVPRFSTSHMVLEYARRLYAPAFENGEKVRGRRAELARELVAWRRHVEARWPLVHVRSVKRAGADAVEIEAFCGGIEPGSFACRDDDGRDCPLRSSPASPDGVTLLRVSRPGPGATRLRLYPTHPELVHSVELGLSLEIVL